MVKPTLVILAAGMGSRYGGLKQIDPVDKRGHLIIDYSVFDALRAGFSRVVCIIKQAMEADFQEIFANRVSPHVDLECAFQELSMLPLGYTAPEGREKPWGTGHALLCAQPFIEGPFAVINADDYYGPSAFETLYAYLAESHSPGEFAMVNYLLEQTLTEHGEVTRGVCLKGEAGYLAEIEETQGIRAENGGGAYRGAKGLDVFLPAGTPVSMNFWGFDRSLFQELNDGFTPFLEKGLRENPLKCEYLLPSVIETMLQKETASVKMLQSQDKWYGVTYREDKPAVLAAMEKLRQEGVYPELLWD